MKIPAGTIKRIHVNQHNIRANRKNELEAPGKFDALPEITVKTSKGNIKGMVAEIDGPSKVVSVYADGCNQLSCGARVWIETHAEVIVS